uniref:Ovule protein n=1 Tax=Brugia timori TaxID=42155 RepID=A0A0R3RDA3_9BILA
LNPPLAKGFSIRYCCIPISRSGFPQMQPILLNPKISFEIKPNKKFSKFQKEFNNKQINKPCQ